MVANRTGIRAVMCWIVSSLLSSGCAPAFGQTPHSDTTSSGSIAATIRFTNGDQLVGQFLSATATGVSFIGKVTGAALLSVQWTDVDVVLFPVVRLCVVIRDKGNSHGETRFEISTSVIRMVNGNLEVPSDNGPNVRVLSLNNLLSIEPSSACSDQVTGVPTLLRGWGGQLQSQGGLITSTQKQYSIGADVHIARPTSNQTAFKYQTTDIDIQANYGESSKPGSSPVITELYEGQVRQDIYVTDNQDASGARRFGGPRVFVLADFYHNLSLGMNLEQGYGAGFGWVTQRGSHTFGFEADLRYIGEDLYSPGIDQNLLAVRIYQNYSYKFVIVKGKPVILSESGAVIPALNNPHAFQARGIVKATVPLTPHLSIGLQESDDYLRNAPPKSKQNYSNLQATFTYILNPPLK
jgi:hypothetical protein